MSKLREDLDAAKIPPKDQPRYLLWAAQQLGYEPPREGSNMKLTPSMMAEIDVRFGAGTVDRALGLEQSK